jgi:crotonobetainyl-CoA:carnitine CoA-transferase CaiB-like acyl-CoA transferase
MPADRATQGALAGLRVIDVATLFAGPTIATLMADFGADVIKVEHPRGDGQRNMGWQSGDHGTSLWWKFLGRNKRCVTLDLHKETAQRLFRELIVDADVLIENFRPGTLERWGLGYDDLCAINPHLIMVRVTAFGQNGPYRDRPGFGTMAEAMSGFAHINGFPDGPPTLPPFALADMVAGLFGSSAAMFAVFHRDRQPDRPGQMIDLSIYEPMFWVLGPQASVYDQLGIVAGRRGNRTDFTSPRNMYADSEGRWLALSASTQSVAARVARMIGRPDFLDNDWYSDHTGRLAHQDELDAAIAAWAGERTTAEIMAAAVEFEVAMAPVYSIADIVKDPQYVARETITTIDDEELGPVQIQNVTPRLSHTPGRINHLGPMVGAHNKDLFVDELGHSVEDLKRWKAEGAI